MNKFLFLIPILLGSGIGFAYAEPFEEIETEIIRYDGNFADVKISWNQEDIVFQYEVGCVSCFPNVSETTIENSIILNDVTSVGENSTTLLYVIAYNSDNEVIKANQIFVELEITSNKHTTKRFKL